MGFGSETNSEGARGVVAGNEKHFSNSEFILRFLRQTFLKSPPLYNEARFPAELVRFMGSANSLGFGVPKGNGQGVLAIPGAGAGDYSLLFLRNYLDKIGYAPYPSGISVNIQPAEKILPDLEKRLGEIYDETGRRKVTIIGHSLGGALGKILSDRHPDQVQQVVGLAPVFNPYIGISPALFAMLFPVAVYDFAKYGLGTVSRGLDMFRELSEPAKVPLVSIYSKSDGVLTYKSCMRKDSRNYEVESSHVGMAVNIKVYWLLAELLHNSYYCHPPTAKMKIG